MSEFKLSNCEMPFDPNNVTKYNPLHNKVGKVPENKVSTYLERLSYNKFLFEDSYAKMPWLSLHLKTDRRAIFKKFDIVGVPVCIAIETTTGFVISKKARVDIFELGVGCLK